MIFSFQKTIKKYIIIFYLPKKKNGVFVIIPGQSEPALKYAELYDDLKNLNYDFYILDIRGQGLSDRLLPDPIKSHVEDFSDYIQDLRKFSDEIVKPRDYSKSVLFGHSMGGAIVAGFLEKNSTDYKKVILSSPMFKINTAPYSEFVAFNYVSLLKALGKGLEYAPTQSPFKNPQSFDNNKSTQSKLRFDLRETLYRKYPELQVGGTTVSWIKTSLQWTSYLRNKENLLKTSTLLFQAGKDKIVLPEGQNQFCKSNPKLCVMEIFSNAKHEIYMESDIIRSIYIEKILNFLAL